MNVIITGASEMIGGLILKQCLQNEKSNTTRILLGNQRAMIIPNLTEIVMKVSDTLKG